MSPGKGIIGARTVAGAGPSIVGGQGFIPPPQQQQTSPTAAPATNAPIAPGVPVPIPGVSGITPGAIERRLSGNMSIPPTAQVNPGIGESPTVQLQNTVGTDPRNIQDPVALIRALLERQGGMG